MEALSQVLAVAKEAGIMTVTVVVSAYFVLQFIRLLGTMLKSSDSRWNDIIKVLQEQLVVQREGNKAVTDMTVNMQSGFTQLREDFDQKIDALEEKIDQLDTEIKRLLLLVGEDKADG